VVRAVVLFLVLPSLLMPPGVCICRYAVEQPELPARIADVVVPTDNGPRSAGCCKKCRPVAHLATESQSTATGKTQHPPADQDHAPNCPAAGLTTSVKIVEPPVAVSDLELVSVGWLVELVTAPTVSPLPASDHFAPSAPRYISFRALLI